MTLGNPTQSTMEVAVLPYQAVEAYVEYGAKKTETRKLEKGQPATFKLEGLNSREAITYRLRYREAEGGEYLKGPDHSFHLPRPEGTPFSFVVQGDSHPERTNKMHSPALYERALQMASSQKPDFLICLGDDFSLSNLDPRTRETVDQTYAKQVPYLGLVGADAPVFLVNGNHELAAKVTLDGSPNSLGVLAQTARNRFFAQPEPGRFFSGNGEKVEHIGYLRNYFGWTWGDATFLVIDPYWHSDVSVDTDAEGGKRNRDLWAVTLGESQYKWLRDSLSKCRSKFIFVFAHHVLGTGRGGVERAGLYEWGGKSPNGRDEFATHRPGWDLPIHQLMAKYKVSAFIQGHDHIYAYQQLDGVVYQSAPVPADPNYALMNDEAYTSGTKLAGSGQICIRVSPQNATVEYRRAVLPADEKDGFRNGEVAHRYEIAPRKVNP